MIRSSVGALADAGRRRARRSSSDVSPTRTISRARRRSRPFGSTADQRGPGGARSSRDAADDRGRRRRGVGASWRGASASAADSTSWAMAVSKRASTGASRDERRHGHRRALEDRRRRSGRRGRGRSIGGRAIGGRSTGRPVAARRPAAGADGSGRRAAVAARPMSTSRSVAAVRTDEVAGDRCGRRTRRRARRPHLAERRSRRPVAPARCRPARARCRGREDHLAGGRIGPQRAVAPARRSAWRDVMPDGAQIGLQRRRGSGGGAVGRRAAARRPSARSRSGRRPSTRRPARPTKRPATAAAAVALRSPPCARTGRRRQQPAQRGVDRGVRQRGRADRRRARSVAHRRPRRARAASGPGSEPAPSRAIVRRCSRRRRLDRQLGATSRALAACTEPTCSQAAVIRSSCSRRTTSAPRPAATRWRGSRLSSRNQPAGAAAERLHRPPPPYSGGPRRRRRVAAATGRRWRRAASPSGVVSAAGSPRAAAVALLHGRPQRTVHLDDPRRIAVGQVDPGRRPRRCASCRADRGGPSRRRRRERLQAPGEALEVAGRAGRNSQWK